jgi:hypothetical protein
MASGESGLEEVRLVLIKQGYGAKSIGDVEFLFIDYVCKELNRRRILALRCQTSIGVDRVELARHQRPKQCKVVFDWADHEASPRRKFWSHFNTRHFPNWTACRSMVGPQSMRQASQLF